MKKLVFTALMIALMLTTVLPVQSASTMTHGQMLKELGMINGDEFGNLNEDQLISRVEMIVIVNRMSDFGTYVEIPFQPTFSDVSRSHWAFSQVEKAYANGVTNGIGDNLFGTNENITYNQAIAFMLRVLNIEFEYFQAIDVAASQLDIELEGVAPREALTRGQVFKLMSQTLLQEFDTDKVLIDEIEGYTQLPVQTFKSRMTGEENVMIQSLSFEFPDINRNNYIGIDIPDDWNEYIMNRSTLESNGPTIINLFKGNTFKVLQDYSEVKEAFPKVGYGDNVYGFSTTNVQVYSSDGNMDNKHLEQDSGELFFNIGDKSIMYLSGTLGNADRSLGRIHAYKGNEVEYKNEMVTPYLLVCGYQVVEGVRTDTVMIFVLLDDNGFVDGVYTDLVYGHSMIYLDE